MNVALREPETAIHSGLIVQPVGQLPVPVQPSVATPDLYGHVDAAMGRLERAMTVATQKVGTYAPYYAQARSRGYNAIAGVAAVGAVVTGVALALGLGWAPSDAAGAAFTGAFFTGLLAAGGWHVYSKRAEANGAARPPNAKELAGVREIAAEKVSILEQAALGEAADAWQHVLTNRKVFGFEAQQILSDLTARRASIPADDVDRARRWSRLRSAIAAYTDGYYVDHRMLLTIREAFQVLPTDEQQELAPTVLTKVFEREAPLKKGWQFHEGYKLYSQIYRVSQGLPADPPTEESAEAIPSEPTDEPSQAVARWTTIASLDATAAAFEAALQPCLQQQRSVTADDIAPALAIARASERTPVELVALSVRTKRFLQELDEKQLYGYAARQSLAELAKAGERIAPGLRDQIARIDRYRSTLDMQKPTSLGSSAVSLILKAIDELLPCDRVVGAERAYARYFHKDGTPRFRADYADQQRLLNALLDEIRKANAPAC